MKRQEIYIQAPTRAELLADLEALGYVQDDDVRLPDGCAYDMPQEVTLAPAVTDAEGNEITPPVLLNGAVILISCTPAVAAALHGAVFETAQIVDYQQGFPVFGGRAEDLASIKASAILSIDAEAERRRGLIVTPGVGQMQEYRLTADEAGRAQAAADPLEATDYPYLAAEQAAQAAVGVTWTLRDTAAFVLGEEAAWVAYGAAIKETRRTAKERVKAATSAAQVREILDAVAWPAIPGQA